MRFRPGRAAPIWRSARGNIALAVTSVALAILIWFTVIDTQNETVEELLGFGVVVEPLNVPGSLATASAFPVARITITGRERDIASLSDQDFTAIVDLAGLEAGTHELPVFVRSLDDDVRVRAVTPETIEVVLAPVVDRTFPVRVVIANPPPLGFEVGDPETSQELVSVSGIEAAVALVDAVVAPVNLAGATVDLELPVPLEARSATGAVVREVRVAPAIATVRVPIEQIIFRRSVAVVPTLSGRIATGFRLQAVSVDPPSVVVVGTLEALRRVTVVETEPIPLIGARQDHTVTAQLTAPGGLALEEDAPVRVSIAIVPLRSQATFLISVQVENLDEGLEASVAPERVDVVVEGPAQEVVQITDTALSVSVNAGGLAAGGHELGVQVGFPAGLAVNVIPESVFVTITVVESAPSDGEAES